MIHGPVIWTKIDDNLDFAQVLQRLYTFPVTVRIFLALKMKWEAYLKPVICIRVLSRSRILQSSSYFEEKKEAGTSARVFTRLRFLTQQVLSDFSRSLLEISFSCRFTDNSKTFTCINFSQQYFLTFYTENVNNLRNS